MITVFEQAIGKHQRLYKRRLLQKEIAAKMGVSPSYVSVVLGGGEKCPEAWLDDLANCLFPNHPHERRAFKQDILDSNATRDLDPGSARFRVRILSYGSLKEEELTEEISLGGISNLHGPAGFLVDCFARMVNFTGQEDLVASVCRQSLGDILGFNFSAGKDVLLSHLAAGNLINKRYFFCTPVSLGIGALLFLGGIPAKDRAPIVKRIRESFFGSPEGTEQLQIQCMEHEVGHKYLKMLPSSPPIDTSIIKTLSISECCRALQKALRSDLSKIPTLVVDELTCYLTLKRLGRESALLFDSETDVPRFYFGFSVSRADRDLRKELDRGSDLYLQSDVTYIIKRYTQMYWELVAFAESLQEFSGPSWVSKSPHAWAQRVCGITPKTVPSALISPSWLPILAAVRKALPKIDPEVSSVANA
jgi:hypothetical protein